MAFGALLMIIINIALTTISYSLAASNAVWTHEVVVWVALALAGCLIKDEVVLLITICTLVKIEALLASNHLLLTFITLIAIYEGILLAFAYTINGIFSKFLHSRTLETCIFLMALHTAINLTQ